jgi:hypothetical protein
MIKPGSVCYLVNLLRNQQDTGRVVTVAEREQAGYWFVTAEWLAKEYPQIPFYVAHQSQLLPINDPDEPVTTHTPEALTA